MYEFNSIIFIIVKCSDLQGAIINRSKICYQYKTMEKVALSCIPVTDGKAQDSCQKIISQNYLPFLKLQFPR